MKNGYMSGVPCESVYLGIHKTILTFPEVIQLETQRFKNVLKW